MLKNKALTYTVFVYAVSALYSLLYLIFPLNDKSSPVSNIITPVYMFIPLICSVILSKLVYKESFRENISLKFKWNDWYFFALLIPIVLAFLAFGFSLLLPGISLAPDMAGMLGKFKEMLTPEQFEQAVKQSEHMKEVFKTDYYYLIVGALNAVVFGATINMVFAFGEEAGWRGFLLNALKDKGFFKASLIIGVIWGVWHLPVIIQGHNYGKYHVIGIFMMTAWTVLLSPLFTYVVYKTGSVLSAAIMHGVINAAPGIALAYIKGGDELTMGITGFAGFLGLIVINAGIFIYEKYFAEEKVIF
jgi:membrane protease YdiL (CAAX protease family)